MSDDWILDVRGRTLLDGTTQRDIEGMSQPVRCSHCGGVYDLGKVEVWVCRMITRSGLLVLNTDNGGGWRW